MTAVGPAASSPVILALTGATLAVALVWAALLQVSVRVVQRYDGPRPLGLLLLVTGLMALHCVLEALLLLAATPLGGVATALAIATDASLIAGIATLRHIASISGFVDEPAQPGPLWWATNYGAAVAVALLVAWIPIVGLGGDASGLVSRGVLYLYVLGMLLLAGRDAARFARGGRWQAGGLGEIRRLDLIVAGGAVLVLVVVGVALAFRSVGARHDAGGCMPLVVVGDLALSVALAFPFVVRLLNEAIPRFLTDATTVVVAAALYIGGPALRTVTGAAGLDRAFDLFAILALVVLLGPGRRAVRAGVERLILRRSRRRREALQAFLRTLSPEVGTVECCRRALARVTSESPLRGAAVILRSGGVLRQGEIAIEPLARAWPRGAEADFLPTRAFGTPDFWDLPPALKAALDAADIVGVLPIVSPRCRWGHLFATAGHLASIYSDEDIHTFEDFAARLALVLDAADLLARTVDVERSLAHAEKLAAIGETAARIAHDIRNPVTAARSLAQQLASEDQAAAVPAAASQPVPAGDSPPALILAELDRVERQVASLLRFARRDELCLEKVDLAALVRATTEQLRPRLAAADIDVELHLERDVHARADREKLRQVLVNLIENAIDALGSAPRPKGLSLFVGGANGTAVIRVTDSGPGVPEHALPRLFEPFFSLKEHGTGLGLAIVKRTIEAHGGTIEAAAGPGAGMQFAISLSAVGGDE